jgi:hypothetical protein
MRFANKLSTRTKFYRRTVFPGLLTGSLSTICSAQVVAESDYTVVHTFRFQPAGDVVEVLGSEFRHAWIQTAGILGDVWSVESLSQMPDFDPFGTESFTGSGTASGVPIAFNSGLAGMPVPCVYNTFDILPVGFNNFQCIILPLGQSLATACTEFFVSPYSPLPPFDIQGNVGSTGGVRAVNAGCYAYSSAAVSVRGGINLANGNIQWSPFVSEIVAAGEGAVGSVIDPVHFVATNLDTGDQVQARLFDYTMSTSGPGMILWGSGIFETDHKDLEFVMEIPPTHVAPGESGSMHLLIENGVVTVADDTGVFDGMLPPIGESVPLILPLPNDFSLNYDLNLDPTFNWEVTTDLSGAGGAQANSACAADLNGDRELNFFDISLFLKLYSTGDPDADFNNDKELNFFDVSEFLSAFSKGCSLK